MFAVSHFFEISIVILLLLYVACVNYFSIRVNSGSHDEVSNCCKQDYDDHSCSSAPLPPQKLQKSPTPPKPSLAVPWLM